MNTKQLDHYLAAMDGRIDSKSADHIAAINDDRSADPACPLCKGHGEVTDHYEADTGAWILCPCPFCYPEE